MSAPLPSVTIVIVAFHHADHLPATLAALARLDYPADRYEVVIVDNGGGDSLTAENQEPGAENTKPRGWGAGGRGRAEAGTQPAVPSAANQAQAANREPQISRSIQNPIIPDDNLGFAGGCNLAVNRSAADVIVLVNPDLQPRPDFLRAIVAPLADPTVGMVGARLLLPDGATLQHAGGWLQPGTLLAQHYGDGAPDNAGYDQPRDVPFVTGAALAIGRATWQRLGGLDEAFWPAYYEEVDLCWRARQHGLRVRYEPRAVALHHEASSLGKHSATYHRLFHRNRLRLIFKHHADDWLLHCWLPAELAHLRATADDHEIDGLMAAYLYWQDVFVGAREHGSRGAGEQEPETRNSKPETRNSKPELTWTVQQVQHKRTIAPLPFVSRWALVARLRTIWNRIATETYLRPLIQQQNDFNATVAELAQAIERQRRATDAAIVCQGALLARLLHRPNRSELPES